MVPCYLLTGEEFPLTLFCDLLSSRARGSLPSCASVRSASSPASCQRRTSPSSSGRRPRALRAGSWASRRWPPPPLPGGARDAGARYHRVQRFPVTLYVIFSLTSKLCYTSVCSVAAGEVPAGWAAARQPPRRTPLQNIIHLLKIKMLALNRLHFCHLKRG